MRIKQSARATKCLVHVRGLTLRSPRRVHSCLIVESPMVAMVEQPDPFAADNCSECKARKDEPEPPDLSEGLAFILVAEGNPEEGTQTSEEQKRGVEEDETGLGNQGVFESDEDRT